MNEEQQPAPRLLWIIVCAVLSFLFFFLAIALNAFRYQLFGINAHDAPGNFSFNTAIFIPLVLGSILLIPFVIYGVIAKWKYKPRRRLLLVSFLFILPELTFLVIGLFLLFR
ncbi:MAG TPA: hypothetical protein VFU15_14685 [Bacteroidia bacterium]|nr:hypothetical protein [Bacteroidia bacterium]